MSSEYIPQGHRFNIFEDVGCYPFTYNTPVAYALVLCPPVIVGIVSGVYGFLSLRAFNKSRTQFNELLSSYSNLTSSRYVRLMCLSGIELMLTVPLAIMAIALDTKAGVVPWINWENVHFDFSRVDLYPAIIWRQPGLLQTSLELSRWFIVMCAFIFFGFFGFADEAKKHYRSAFQTVAKTIGISTSFGAASTLNASTGGKSKTTSSAGRVRPVAPTFVHTDFLRRQSSSISSLTDVSIGDVSGHLNEKRPMDEKAEFSPILSYGDITLGDVGGTLADYKEPISPTLSSASSASSFVSNSPVTTTAPALPDPTHQKSNTHDIV